LSCQHKFPQATGQYGYPHKESCQGLIPSNWTLQPSAQEFPSNGTRVPSSLTHKIPRATGHSSYPQKTLREYRKIKHWTLQLIRTRVPNQRDKSSLWLSAQAPSTGHASNPHKTLRQCRRDEHWTFQPSAQEVPSNWTRVPDNQTFQLSSYPQLNSPTSGNYTRFFRNIS
jgi:hypothetical protein